jgi:DNA polymerase V
MFALVDGNSFYASCERVFDPDAARRPVAVLSNNDGVVVAATRDLKRLGVELFRPYFQIKDQLAGRNVKVFSSNYTLYDDMQRRLVSIYRTFAEDVEVYSIDEAFLTLGDLSSDRLLGWGVALREQALRWTGIPVGIGVASSKTLAKLANHLSKNDPLDGQPEGVCALVERDRIEAALKRVELKDVWGVGRGNIRRLAKLGIETPLSLSRADPNRVREHLGVVGQRMVLELRGQACLPLENAEADRKNVCVSRSFASTVTQIESLRESVLTFAAQAGAKLRRQDLAAHGLSVFVQTDRHAPEHVEQYANSAGVRFNVASFDTRELGAAALRCLDHVYRDRHAYKKAGVLLHDLVKREAVQPGLFDRRDHEASRRLMGVIDKVNHAFGNGSLRLAGASPFTLLPCRTWHRRSDNCSPRYTTRWNELPFATARKAV